MSEKFERHAFDNMPKKVGDEAKNLGYTDARFLQMQQAMSAYGVRLFGDYGNDDEADINGVKFAIGAHNLQDALLEAIKVTNSQAMSNVVHGVIKYIYDLVKEPEQGTEKYEMWNRSMNRTWELHDIIEFLGQLEKAFFGEDKLVIDFIDGIMSHEPQLMMIGDMQSVATANGQKYNGELSDDDERQLTELLKQAVKESEEE